MRASHRSLVAHTPALLVAAAVLTAALWVGELRSAGAPPAATAQAQVGPEPEAEATSLKDACSRRVGCLKR
jgi:hypothetical protein